MIEAVLIAARKLQMRLGESRIVLTIDDFGLKRLRDDGSEHFYDVINSRYEVASALTLGSRPAMNFHAWPAPPGLACDAVGMQSALHSAIGLPRRSTSAL